MYPWTATRWTKNRSHDQRHRCQPRHWENGSRSDQTSDVPGQNAGWGVVGGNFGTPPNVVKNGVFLGGLMLYEDWIRMQYGKWDWDDPAYWRFRYKSVALRLDWRSKEDDVPPVPHVKVQQHESQNWFHFEKKNKSLKHARSTYFFSKNNSTSFVWLLELTSKI